MRAEVCSFFRAASSSTSVDFAMLLALGSRIRLSVGVTQIDESMRAAHSEHSEHRVRVRLRVRLRVGLGLGLGGSGSEG